LMIQLFSMRFNLKSKREAKQADALRSTAYQHKVAAIVVPA